MSNCLKYDVCGVVTILVRQWNCCPEGFCNQPRSLAHRGGATPGSVSWFSVLCGFSITHTLWCHTGTAVQAPGLQASLLKIGISLSWWPWNSHQWKIKLCPIDSGYTYNFSLQTSTLSVWDKGYTRPDPGGESLREPLGQTEQRFPHCRKVHRTRLCYWAFSYTDISVNWNSSFPKHSD